MKDKVSEDEIKQAEAARDELQAAIEQNDLEAIKTKRDALNEIVQNLAVKLYEQAAQAQAASEGEGTSSQDDGVVDADFEEVDED